MTTRREWRWTVVFALVIMALTTLPYALAAANEGEAWRFSGALLGVEDGNSYIADMRQGAEGAWLFTLPYTSEAHPPVLFFGFYLLLGKLAGPAHGALVVVFHVARVVAGGALLLVSYRFLAEFLPQVEQRRLALLLVALGGGLGWLLTLASPRPLFDSLPIDFISPEAFSFLTLFGLPHLALARCLFLLGLLAYLRGRGGLAGLAWLGVGLLQPLYVAVAWVLIAGDFALSLVPANGRLQLMAGPWTLTSQERLSFAARRGRLPSAVLAVLISSPLLLYTIFVFSADPVLAQWNRQNQLPSPHPLHYVLGYGVWLVPAGLGWWSLRRSSPRLAQFAAAWLLLAPVLLYLPIPTQRRLIEGFQLPLAALAVLGVSLAGARLRRWTVAALLCLLLPTSVLLWLGAILAARSPAAPIFLPAEQVAVFDWLAGQAAVGDVALAAYDTGNALPAYTPLRAYVGHGPETIHWQVKVPAVGRFYAGGTPDAERQALLAEGHIRYVLYGPPERALGAFDPGTVDYLQLVYARGEYRVYTVVP